MNWGGTTAAGEVAWDFLTSVGSLPDLATLDGRFKTVIRAFGFKKAAYIRITQGGQPIAPRPIFGEDCPEWTERYTRRGYARIDPGIPMLFRATRPFTWTEAEGAKPNREVRDLFGEAREIWAEDGLIVPVRGPGGEVSIVDMVADHRLKLHPDERAALHALCSVYASVGQAFLEPLETPQQPDAPLSRRELQCVYWLSLGKTEFEIGVILDVSPHTVKEYLENARVKLGVEKRIQIVSRALALGLLFADLT